MGFADRVNKIAVGDKVRYSGGFLASTGQQASDIGQDRGIVESIKDYGSTSIAIVAWNDPETPSKVNTRNLEKVPERSR